MVPGLAISTHIKLSWKGKITMATRTHYSYSIFINSRRNKAIFIYYDVDDDTAYIIQTAKDQKVIQMIQDVMPMRAELFVHNEFVEKYFNRLPLRTDLENEARDIVLNTFREMDSKPNSHVGCYEANDFLEDDDLNEDAIVEYYYSLEFDIKDKEQAYEKLKKVILPETTEILIASRTDYVSTHEIVDDVWDIGNNTDNNIEYGNYYIDTVPDGWVRVYLKSVHETFELPKYVNKWDHRETVIFVLISDEGCVQLFYNRKVVRLPIITSMAKKDHPYYDYMIKRAKARGYLIEENEPELTHELLKEGEVGETVDRWSFNSVTIVMNRLRTGKDFNKGNVLFINKTADKALLLEYSYWTDSVYIVDRAVGKNNVSELKLQITKRKMEKEGVTCISDLLDEGNAMMMPIRCYLEGYNRSYLLRAFEDACKMESDDNEPKPDNSNVLSLPYEMRDEYYSCVLDVREYDKAIKTISSMYLKETTYLVIGVRAPLADFDIFVDKFRAKKEPYWGYFFEDRIPEGHVQLSFVIDHFRGPRDEKWEHECTKVKILSSDEGCVELIYNKDILEAPQIVSMARKDDDYYDTIKERKDTCGYEIDESNKGLVHKLLKTGRVGVAVDENLRNDVMKALNSKGSELKRYTKLDFRKVK